MIIQRQTGFTLLEAIVAMTIFATSAMGLYAWINSMLIGTARFDEINVETTDMYNAVDYLSTVNPMENPSGTMQIGEMVLSWDSELVEPVRSGNLVPSYNVGLYLLTVSLSRPGIPEQQFSVRQAGYSLKAEGERRIGL